MNKTFKEELREIIEDYGYRRTTDEAVWRIQKLVEELIGGEEPKRVTKKALADHNYYRGRNALRTELKAKLRGTKDE